MIEDPIVEEVRRASEALLAEYNYELAALAGAAAADILTRLVICATRASSS